MEFYDDCSGRDEHDDDAIVTPDAVMRAWRESVRDEFPWCTMPLDDRTGVMRPIIDELLDVSTGLACPIRLRRIRSAAAAHGAFRRAQRCAKRVVSDDFAMLRLALNVALRRAGQSRPTTRGVLRCLVPDWRMARSAARDGFVVDHPRRRKDP
jgi:hypothetical protein